MTEHSERKEFIEDLRWKEFPILDKGYVALVDVMGSDQDIVDAARVSYGTGTRKVSDNRGLLRYLLRHGHTSPFEMVEVKLCIKLPMDAHRQQIRHRTASVNEYSTRYSEAIDDRQETPPTAWRKQSKDNKQGSGDFLTEWPAKDDSRDIGEYLTKREKDLHTFAAEVYAERIALGVAREQARKDLPLSTYTKYYWKMDLHNLFHYLKLRMDPHAQKEIRELATSIANNIVQPLFPLAYEAFVDYKLESLTLTGPELRVLRRMVSNWPRATGDPLISFDATEATDNDLSAREQTEFKDKLKHIGILQ